MTGYKILHNTTGSVVVNQTTDTNFTVENFEPGVYLFTVLAINILGNGVENPIVVTVTGYYNRIFAFKYTYIYTIYENYAHCKYETRRKSFQKNSFQVGMELKKVYRNKAEMKISRTLPHYKAISVPSL